MKKDYPLKVGDVVQLRPEYSPDVFGGAFMVVSEVNIFGAKGYCHALKGSAVAYIRPKWADMEFIGRVVWAVGEGE